MLFRSLSPKSTNPDKNMTLVEHLEELRTRVIFSVIFLFLGLVVGFIFAKDAVGLLLRPFQSIKIERQEKLLRFRIADDGALRLADPAEIDLVKSADEESREEFLRGLSAHRLAFYFPGTTLEQPADFTYGISLQKPIFTNPLDPITLYFKAAAILGIILALPLILHQLMLFVMPGLKPAEKKTLISMLALGSVLFPAGAAFAYLMFSMILNFLLNFQIGNIEPLIEVFKFINLELRLMIGMGVAFEFPLLVMFLTFLGIIKPAQLRKYRPHVVIILAFTAMAFTPPDPVSMLIMLVPLIILYEVSIWLSLPLARKRATKE